MILTYVEKMEILEMLSDVTNVYKAKIIVLAELVNREYNISLDTMDKVAEFEKIEQDKFENIILSDEFNEIISEYKEMIKTPYSMINYVAGKIKLKAKDKKELETFYKKLQKDLTNIIQNTKIEKMK